MSEPRVKVLMFAEAVTLAHVARPVALARQLDPARFDVTIACDPRYADFATGSSWTRVDLASIPSAQFNRALAKGAPVYDLATLRAYADEDLRLMAEIRPDIVVGDFRLSLSASARAAQVPYLAIANAYWSPYYQRPLPLPVLPMTRMLPLPLADVLFAAFRRLAFSLHCKPMNELRAHHGLASLGHDLRRVYTDADHHLIPDVEALYPVLAPRGHCSYVRPLMWSPDVALPTWWDEPAPPGHPTVYVTLGSSGSTDVLRAVLQALAPLPVRVIASTAGPVEGLDAPDNARLASYLPGDRATARSRLVICNGGSLTTQQALSLGVPVLGIASNMDQFFNMGPLVEAGVAKVLRADRLSPGAIAQASRELLDSSMTAQTARSMQPLLDMPASPAAVFDKVVALLLPAARVRRDQAGTPSAA